jgi:glycosyltransferase involved in cell wall biosynthesis
MVSVIVPNYNHAPFLQQRLDSILNQTYQNFELIILDDCSSDNSRESIEKYRGHPKVSAIVYNDANSGTTFKQWNKGVALARGEWIWIAESDDAAEPDFLEQLLKQAQATPGAAIVFANSFIIDDEGKKISSYSKEMESWSPRWQQDYYNSGKDECISYFRFFTVILNVSSCIFKKNIFLQAGGCDESFKLAGDWISYIKMLQFGDIAYLARPLNYSRRHAQTVRSRSGRFLMFFETLRCIGYTYRHFTIAPAEKKKQVYSLLGQLLEHYPHFSVVERKAIFNYMQKELLPAARYMWYKLRASMLVKKLTQ